jgi:hypothetical protein
LRLPEIQLLAVVPTQLKFSTVKDHDEPTIVLFETLFCMWECFNMGTELPAKVILGQTLVLMQIPFLNNVRNVGRLVLSRTSCFCSVASWLVTGHAIMLQIIKRHCTNADCINYRFPHNLSPECTVHFDIYPLLLVYSKQTSSMPVYSMKLKRITLSQGDRAKHIVNISECRRSTDMRPV